MNPTTRYELEPGEWRPDPPRVSYGCDRSRLVALLGEELRASVGAQGASAAGPTLEVRGRTLGCPVTEHDIEWLQSVATPAPYGRGEETLLDPTVRDALQIEADDIRIGTAAWDDLRSEMLRAVAADMGLQDATLRLVPLKLLIYRAGGHFAEHADTEKTPGMIASLALILPGQYEGGALVVEHAAERLRGGGGGSPRWRWVAWYADCRHWLEPVRSGVRLAMTFGVAIDAEQPLTRRKASSHQLGWTLWGRSYAEEHTAWAARGRRSRAGNEQYGQKLVWVLSHRYTEPGLRAPLLKGRDRELARTLIDDPHGEACYLGWLQIRETGSALTESGDSWGDDAYSWDDVEQETDIDPPPDAMLDQDGLLTPDDPAPLRIKHRDTPELHLEAIARQNTWLEGLRSLDGEAVEHGDIEVLDGEIVPHGALAHAIPDGGRVYEATGNEGASLELQYRHAVLVLWRRNPATLRMLARCGGRLALAVEMAQRDADPHGNNVRAGCIEDVLSLWREALESDGGAPEPEAHRLILKKLQGEGHAPGEYVPGRHLRWRYVENVAAVDLEAEAVPKLVVWINESLDAGDGMAAWVRALRPACGEHSAWYAHSGAPALLRALCEHPRTGALAVELLACRREPPTTTDAVLREADLVEKAVVRREWLQRRDARMTVDG